MGLELFFSMPFLGGSNSQTCFFQKDLEDIRHWKDSKLAEPKIYWVCWYFWILTTEVVQLKAFRMIVWWPGCWRIRWALSFEMVWPAKHIKSSKSAMFNMWRETRWWQLKYFLCSSPIIWGRFPIWLIYFRWVETTNQQYVKRKYSVWATLWYSFQSSAPWNKSLVSKPFSTSSVWRI